MYRVLLTFSLFFTGCASWYIPPEAKIEASKNASRMDAYIAWMNAGRTTREQDQQLIRALRRAWHAQNLALNDVPLPPDVESWFAHFELMGQTPPVEVDSQDNTTMPENFVPPPIDWNALSR